MLKKVFNSYIFNGVAMLIGGFVGLVSSIVLTLEVYWSALHQLYIPSCDINETFSCSKVASSWQATLLSLSKMRPIPNSILGIPIFTIICFVGFLYAIKVILPKSVKILMWIMVLVMAGFSGWLLFQSYYDIHAFCPWCLFMDLGVVVILLESFVVLNISRRKARLQAATDKVEHVDRLIPFDEWKQKLNNPNKIAKK